METARQIAARYGVPLMAGVKIKKIPTGQSSFPAIIWSEAEGQLRYDVTPEQRKDMARRGNRFSANNKGNQNRSAQTGLSMKRVQALSEEGKSIKEIAAIVGLTENTVGKYRRAMGIKAHGSALLGTGKAHANAKLIMKLHKEGKSAREIGRVVGLGKSTINTFLRRAK